MEGRRGANANAKGSPGAAFRFSDCIVQYPLKSITFIFQGSEVATSLNLSLNLFEALSDRLFCFHLLTSLDIDLRVGYSLLVPSQADLGSISGKAVYILVRIEFVNRLSA